MFQFNTADVQEFEREAMAIDQPYKVLEIGGRFEMVTKSE